MNTRSKRLKIESSTKIGTSTTAFTIDWPIPTSIPRLMQLLDERFPLVHRLRTERLRREIVGAMTSSWGRKAKGSKFLAAPGWRKVLFGGAFEYEKYGLQGNHAKLHDATPHLKKLGKTLRDNMPHYRRDGSGYVGR